MGVLALLDGAPTGAAPNDAEPLADEVEVDDAATEAEADGAGCAGSAEPERQD